tara:strand:- start:166 stop:333 length:168 start_codon:yes stop_codon:yes gene_type:complete
MSELFKQKALETEKLLNEKEKMGKGGTASEQEVQDRKARLLAQRDNLRRIKEEKR